MKDLIIVAILLVIVGLAIWYIVKAKKSGKKCIGCPQGCCPSKNGNTSCCCSCGFVDAKED